jgi:hypothetical protein
MSEVKNEGLEVVATLTVSFDEGDGGSAIEQVETHMLLDEGAHGLCRHSEALAGYAVRDKRIAELEAQESVVKPKAQGCTNPGCFPYCDCGGIDDAPVAKQVVMPELIEKLRAIAIRERMFRIEETYTAPEISDSISLLNNEIDEVARLNAANQGGQDE